MLKGIASSESKKRGIGFGSTFKLPKKSLGSSQLPDSASQLLKFSQTPKASKTKLKNSFSSPGKDSSLLSDHRKSRLASPRPSANQQVAKIVKSTFASKEKRCT